MRGSVKMGWGRGVVVAAAMGGLLVAACDNGPSAVETRDRDGETAMAAAEAPTEAQTVSAPAPTVDASAGFTSNRRASSQQRADQLFERNGVDFAAASPEDFAAKARAFIDNPPAGVETVRRGNGDTLYYHAATNTFAVATRDGVPRTMFKPDDGAAYWQVQKDREAARAGTG